MVGDNLNISISLNKSVKIDLIQEAFLCLKNLTKIKSETVTIEKEEPEQLEVEAGSGFRAYYNRFCFDYDGNDYGVLAYFSVVYYSFKDEGECVMLSISPFNHPAGEYLYETNVAFTTQLKVALEQTEAFDLLLFTDDSSYDTPILLTKYKTREDEVADEVLYALK